VRSTHLDEEPWPAIASTAPACVLAVPLGSTEQHGPHLPYSTDTDIARALVDALAARRPGVVVAPALAFGASGEHADFPGTISIGSSALEHVIVELCRSADAFAGVVLVSAHGGNHEPLRNAMTSLRNEGRRVLAWSPRPVGDAHAGRTETSLMLRIRPDAVRTADAAAGDTREIGALLPLLRRDGVRRVSPNGVLGDPTGASASEGAALFAVLAEELCTAVETWSS
jgi:creatinine amidohydrolase